MAVHSHCGGAMARISLKCLSPHEPSGSFGISLSQGPSGSFSIIMIMFMENTWFRVEYSEGPLMDSLRFLSHPAPFCFQIARFSEIEQLSGYSPSCWRTYLPSFISVVLDIEYVLFVLSRFSYVFYLELSRGDILFMTVIGYSALIYSVMRFITYMFKF